MGEGGRVLKATFNNISVITMYTVNQELKTLPQHLSSHLVLSGVVRVDGSLVSCVVFCRPLFVLFRIWVKGVGC
jgi:hypothetical protein